MHDARGKLAQPLAVECFEQPTDGCGGRVQRTRWDEHVPDLDRRDWPRSGLEAEKARGGSVLARNLDRGLGWAQLAGHRAAVYLGERLA